MKKVIKDIIATQNFIKNNQSMHCKGEKIIDTDGEFVKIISEMERREQCKA